MNMYKRYGLQGCLKLICSVIYTKLFFRKSRLIRLPFDLRNKRFINLGANLTTGVGCRIEAHPVSTYINPSLHFGNNIEINDHVHIACGESVILGDNVLIASKVYISDINHGKYSGGNEDNPKDPPNKRQLSTDPVVIEENVWLGESVCVMPGVTIGIGSIVGAASVVTKNIPPYCIAVGNPAKVIKKYNFTNNQWERIIE